MLRFVAILVSTVLMWPSYVHCSSLKSWRSRRARKRRPTRRPANPARPLATESRTGRSRSCQRAGKPSGREKKPRRRRRRGDTEKSTHGTSASSSSGARASSWSIHSHSDIRADCALEINDTGRDLKLHICMDDAYIIYCYIILICFGFCN